MRQIVFDTETTGIDPGQGNRVIEIGCVELENRKLTGNNFHCYINPQRDSEPGALEVHGLTSEFLADKPLFSDIAEAFVDYIRGAELIAHNAAFDVRFLNHEFALDGGRFGSIESLCEVTDSLQIAKYKHPGSPNSLDALCRRYQVDNSSRELHGALLDARLLAEVYLRMTGGQTGLELHGSSEASGRQTAESVRKVDTSLILPVVPADEAELAEHEAYLRLLDSKSDGGCLWKSS